MYGESTLHALYSHQSLAPFDSRLQCRQGLGETGNKLAVERLGSPGYTCQNGAASTRYHLHHKTLINSIFGGNERPPVGSLNGLDIEHPENGGHMDEQCFMRHMPAYRVECRLSFVSIVKRGETGPMQRRRPNPNVT